MPQPPEVPGVDVTVDVNKVSATIDLGEGRPTSNGKSQLLFSTEGYVRLENGMRISINIVAPAKAGRDGKSVADADV
jgi:hypothetical protein